MLNKALDSLLSLSDFVFLPRFDRHAHWYSSSNSPTLSSDPAKQVLKGPYNFDFLTVTREVQEREIERGLLIHLRDLPSNSGAHGFALPGQPSAKLR